MKDLAGDIKWLQRKLLACVVCRPEWSVEIDGLLFADDMDFSRIFSAVRDMHEAGEEVTVVSLWERIPQYHPVYLVQLFEWKPYADKMAHTIFVRDYDSLKRLVTEFCSNA